MDTDLTLFIVVAAVALGTALSAMMTQWLKADDAAADAELGVRTSLREFHGEAGSVGMGASTQAAAVVAASTSMADDETTLARLLAGWGGSGMVLGIAFGATMWGATGALLGGILASTLSIGAVVVAVSVLDRVHARHAEETRLAAEAREQAAAASPDGAVRAS